MVLTEEQKLCYKPSLTEGRQEDLVLMTDISAEAVESILNARYDRDDMYTSIGPVLIAVNPYRLIFKGDQPIYAEDVARHYYKSSPLEVAPHIFRIASDAFKSMQEYHENQTIIVTGESGAGKTEAAKQLMTFMTLVCLDNEASSSNSSAPARRLTISDDGSVSTLDGLSLAERIESQNKMSAKDRVMRGLADLAERETVNRKLRSRNVKTRNSKNVLAALRPNAADVELLRSSAENEIELRETFESICEEADGEQYVTIQDIASMSEISELMEMGTITEEFLLEVARGVTGEETAEEPAGLHLNFPQFKQALKLVEVEVQYMDDTKKTERRRAQSIFDYHHVAMDLLEDPVPTMDGEDAVNPLQLMSLNDIRAQLLESNPVLEAFGNSQTIRNDNSSRFGKYLELQFNGAGNLIGGKVSTYVLEKARLVHQGEKERNFHVLHLFTHGSMERDREQYLLEPPEAYNYLQFTDKKIDGDEERFTLSTLKDSLRKIGIGNKMQTDIFQVLSGILTLGNITFEDHGSDAAATITNPDVLARCCMLLHVDPGPLEAAIVAHKLRQAENAPQSSPSGDDNRSRRVTVAIRYHDMCEAAVCRDTLAKETYNRLFLWIVNAINTNIEYRGPNKRTIGILDIYGFEIFEDNHFEQFCINWVNEKLQQFFIEQTLRAEQLEYEAEKVEWTYIEYFDNKVVVDVIESKRGILSILDDQLSFKNCNAETFTNAIRSTLGDNSHVISPDVYTRKNSDKTAFKFGIRHYAGDVCYNAMYFIEKNTDALYEDVMKVMRSSRSPFIAELFADRRSGEEKSKRPPTIGVQFRKHLGDLVSTLRNCKPHYVRCIKPNDEKSPEYLDRARVIHQIQYLGIVENIKVRRAGYCHRSTFKEFVSRYRMLSTHTWPRWNASSSDEDCRHILNSTSPMCFKHSRALETPSWQDNVDYKMGVTKVFIKDPTTLFVLEKNRAVAMNAIVRKVQAVIRGFVAWSRYGVIRRGFIKWQANVRCFLGKKHYARTRVDIIRFQAFARRFVERCRYRKLYERFKGVPPRIYARKMQAVTRGFQLRCKLIESEPGMYKKLRCCVDNIRTSGQRLAASLVVERVYRGHVGRTRFARRKLAWLRVRFYMKLKVRRVMAKKKWDKEYHETINTLRSTGGLTLIKCRHNGTSATEKSFRLMENNLLQWNTGLFSKMKLGIQMNHTTEISKGGITYKRDGRQSVAINLKENPFKKLDPSANSSAIPSDQMEDLAITIANPPLHELIIVAESKEARDKLYNVFTRFLLELEPSTILEEPHSPASTSGSLSPRGDSGNVQNNEVIMPPPVPCPDSGES
mmetsp:Transcript_26235/g.38878  ORF Transcript_26235/g.38878 Transcript_26235/m.38878 type:complete len:1321 (+) Transcript_26235:88-4050(+)